MIRKLTIFLFLILVSAACGKRGDPVPPVPVIPKETTDLFVAQRGPRIILSWTYPSLTTAGSTLGEIRKLVVWRSRETLPTSLSAEGQKAEATAAAPASEPKPEVLFSGVPVPTPDQFLRVKTRVAEFDASHLGEISVGAKLRFEDRPPLQTEQGRPVRYTYAVTTVGRAGTSALSNLVSVVPLDVARAPKNVRAEITPPAVVLQWQAPAQTVTGGDQPQIQGYNVYRLSPDETLVEPLQPVNGAPIQGTTWSDTPPYGVHRYAVTAVTTEGPPRAESEFPLLVMAQFEDRMPPPVPESLEALTEEKSVRLVWDPVEAADLAGYRVYRITGDHRELLTPELLDQPLYVDAAPPTGVEFIYAVTSVDRTGNESEIQKSDPVLVPTS